MKYKSIREEELKNKVAADWFKHFDTTEILGNIDFTVFPKQNNIFGRTPLLWAEAKTGDYDLPAMFVQLILTIGKARTFDKTLPPAFLGAFDGKKIAFVPYISVQDIFYLNDFNWNVTPSNHNTKEFKLVKQRIEETLQQNTYIYDYIEDEKDLKHFIANNISNATQTAKIKIDKNNFIPIYLRWLDILKPIIDVNWDDLKKAKILDSDFYLADLFVDDKDTQKIEDDTSIRESLFVIFQNQGYKIAKENLHQMFDATISIKAKETYQQFWKRYKRPPLKEFQGYIIERRDLLVPQDIRERKGAFFTPRQWVELSQKYIADVLGENWQDEYCVWDCAAGTGNLLAGLTNKYHIYASTLDQADVNVMHERIEHGANLLKNHVFQFDFLNDDFSKLPQSLQDIINDPEKRKKLVIYINPPYAEGDNVRGIGRKDVQISEIHNKYRTLMGKASGEMFAQFFTRIYQEIPNSVLAEFSTLKILQAPNFSDFRKFFRASLENFFVVPADTFDNVKGDFPIGFFIWDTSKNVVFKKTIADVYDAKGNFIGKKGITSYDNSKYISDWLELNSKNISKNYVGHLASVGNDFQNQRMIFVDNEEKENWKKGGRHTRITAENLICVSIYNAIRKVIPATWLNDRDQFLFPNDAWQTDFEFQSDCLTFTLFDNSNNIQSKFGVNHWIPFTEAEVDAKERFVSHFMTDFINGKIKTPASDDLFSSPSLSSSNSPSLRGLGGVNFPALSGAVNFPALTGLGGVKISPAYLQSHGIKTDNLIFDDKFLPYNPNLKTNSRELRKAGNLSEALLWKELRASNFFGYSFYRQKPILNYIADFYCKELNLVIEIDGNTHDTEEQIAYDKERDRQMQVLGLTIIRIRDEKVKKDMPNVLREIEHLITPPDPLKEGEFNNVGANDYSPKFSVVGANDYYPRQFSAEATAVFEAGRELWRYYHTQKFPWVPEGQGNYNANASLYDIREYFQGRNDKGRMNPKSSDEKYNELIGNLRDKLKILAEKIAPKVYEYGFLKE